MVSVSFAATDAERADAYALRYDVYVAEMNLYRELADHDRRRLSDTDDNTARLLLARSREDGKVLGALRFHHGGDGPLSRGFHKEYGLARFLPHVPESRMLVLSRYTVRADQRGGPVPSALMATAVRYAVESGVELAFLDCVPHLVGLYEALGFRRYKPNVNCPHTGVLVPMVFAMADGEHLVRLDSPLRYVAPELEQRRAPAWLNEVLGAGASTRATPPDEEVIGLLGRAQAQQDALRGLDDHELRRLVQRSYVIECAANDQVVRRGTVSRSLFILLEGGVDVRIGPLRVATLRPGNVFGEVNFFVGRSRTADVVASEGGARVLHLSERDLKHLMKSDAGLAAKLLYNLAEVACARLAATMGA